VGTDEGCEFGGAILVDDIQDVGSLLSPQLLDEKESYLRLRAQMTAEKFMTGNVVSERIRKWVRPHITKALSGNFDATRAIASLPRLAQSKKENLMAMVESSSDSEDDETQSMEDIDQIIQTRLEMHRADITGLYDHASLKNGAEIIYGGKRGTSKSLIDYLPLFNKLLQKAQLKFYGFGPEAALTPTYPPHTLGQCWSFQQTPLKEQLKDRQLVQSDAAVPDDFKRGSLGTLTIRLPTPVVVESVVIEHIPIRPTDRESSAVRSFRVVGYEDSAATTKAWSLGVFEYNISKNARQNDFLQEFPVSRSIFGNDIPALRSISLAVDSNWGHDYSCLYRFRVHGVEANGVSDN
jgi:hypothetical protein